MREMCKPTFALRSRHSGKKMQHEAFAIGAGHMYGLEPAVRMPRICASRRARCRVRPMRTAPHAKHRQLTEEAVL